MNDFCLRDRCTNKIQRQEDSSSPGSLYSTQLQSRKYTRHDTSEADDSTVRDFDSTTIEQFFPYTTTYTPGHNAITH